MRRVNIYRWSKASLPHGNFGDELSIPLLERLFGIEAVPVPTERAELLAVGSILAHHYDRVAARRESISNEPETADPLYVWGTGLVQTDKPALWPKRLVVSAVRGAVTGDHLDAPDAVLGDPGILSNHLLDHAPPKQAKAALVPHYSDADRVDALDLPAGWKMIDPRWPVMEVVQAIAGSEIVVSSSLHGLIVADAFGIPCVWAASLTPLWGPTPHLKFQDYETGRRRAFGTPVSYEHALSLTPERLSDKATMPGRDVRQWQDELIAAFPFR